MKAVIFADSHSDVATMREAVAAQRPDAIIHLGDHIADARVLHHVFPDIPLFAVPGNTDQYEYGETVALEDIFGKKIMLTHGHTFKATRERGGIAEMLQYAESHGAEIVMYGHTHAAFLHCGRGIWILNPGTSGKDSNLGAGRSYAIMDVADGKINWNFIAL